MNHKIAIITDTNSGLSAEDAAANDVHSIAMPFFIDGTLYHENVDLSGDEFFSFLESGADVSTSQPTPAQVTYAWKRALKTHDHVIFIPMSSGLSGTCKTAQMLAADFDGRVHVVDNKRISVSQRQSVMEAVHLRDQGKSVEEILHQLNITAMQSSIYVAVDTLTYLKKGGRVTSSAAAIGTVLNIKPVLQIQGGKLDAFRKVRGRKAAMEAIIQGVQQDLEQRFPHGSVCIRTAYTGTEEQGRLWQKEVQKSFPHMKIGLDPLPLSIACHLGPGAMGIGVMYTLPNL